MKINYSYFLLILFSICSISFGYSQDRFERMYASSGTDVLATALHEVGSGYLVLGVEINEDGESEYINLTQLNAKGNIDWSKSYDYDMDDLFISELGEVELMANGAIAFSAYLQKDSLNKMVTMVDQQGNVLWTRLTGRDTDDLMSNGSRSNLISLETAGLTHITALANDNTTDIFMSSFDLGGESIWNFSLQAQDTLGNSYSSAARDVIFTNDSSLLVVGNVMSEDHQIFLTKMDTLGDILWSRSYTADLGTGITQTSMSVHELVDSTIVVLAAQAGALSTTALLLHVDRDGEYIESTSLNHDGTTHDIVPVSVVGLIDTTVAVGLKRIDLLTSEVEPMIIKMGFDSSEIYYQTLLKGSTDLDPSRGGMLSPDSMAAVFLTSSIKIDSMTLTPYIVKVDPSGNTDCSEALNVMRSDSIFFATDTLVWIKTDEMQIDSVEVMAQEFSDYNPPLLTLADTTFCPQDPVQFVVDASVRGATAYLWDDGNTDSIRLFTETGMFSVIVTVGIEECFTLCDTTTISQKEFPMAAITVDDVLFCTDGTLGLTVSANNPIVDLTWSTGDKTQQIVVSDLIEYTVQITDDCGNMADASIDLRDFTIRNNPSIEISEANLCTDNTLTLTATGPGINPDELLWSTNVTGPSIVVSEPGTYSVENMAEFCPGEASIQIVENQFITPLIVQINSACDDANNNIQLVSGGMGIVSQTWSTGAQTPVITVTTAGTYTVEARDICGNTETATIEITEDDINDCIDTPEPPMGPDCLSWPNAIYPASNNEENRSFGPEDMNCAGMTIENYELNIYNRWGNKVFDSSNIGTRWNGRKNNDGKEQPADTYFYYASYTIDGTDHEWEGDVTIIR